MFIQKVGLSQTIASFRQQDKAPAFGLALESPVDSFQRKSVNKPKFGTSIDENNIPHDLQNELLNLKPRELFAQKILKMQNNKEKLILEAALKRYDNDFGELLPNSQGRNEESALNVKGWVERVVTSNAAKDYIENEKSLSGNGFNENGFKEKLKSTLKNYRNFRMGEYLPGYKAWKLNYPWPRDCQKEVKDPILKKIMVEYRKQWKTRQAAQST